MNHKSSAPASAGTTIRPANGFTAAQQKSLLLLKEQYRLGGDLMSARGYDHLRFIRWLYQTGRLDP
jgi:hypothetical protein